MTTIRPYYSADGASALYYDLITAADGSLAGDIDLYAALAPPGGSILELGTGTGRVAIALAERGFDVTGLDIAPSMLAQANAKRALLPADIAAHLRFVRGDLRSLALGRRFDAIVVSYFTLAHVQPSSGWKKAFGGMARHVAPGGRIAIHLPDAERMGGPVPRRDVPVFRRQTDDGGTLMLYVVDQGLNSATGRFDLTLDYVDHGADGAERRRSRERYTLFVGDPVPYAQDAGLSTDGEAVPLGTTGFVRYFR